MCNTKDDIKLTDTKSTKLDAERSKREDSLKKYQIKHICDGCDQEKMT